ncbi:hypothetical protein AQ505_17275 [Pedobacter sp. PACM 27299]|nr:hypothetical protein AQ505_17275 [Pedobacter sp. PACM 27299]
MNLSDNQYDNVLIYFKKNIYKSGLKKKIHISHISESTLPKEMRWLCLFLKAYFKIFLFSWFLFIKRAYD